MGKKNRYDHVVEPETQVLRGEVRYGERTYGLPIVQDEKPDMVNHPPHYNSDPSGVECIQITRHRNFNIGNAIKYLWRAGLKQDATMKSGVKEVEDLRKAIFYIEDEIARLTGEAK